MPLEMICTIITVVGTVISALVSYGISRHTAGKELERMRLEWEREDVMTSEDDFAEMASAVAAFVYRPTGYNQQSAMETVAAIRAREIGELGNLLDSLYMCIQSGDTSNSDVWLSKVICQKREANRKSKPGRHT